MSLYTIKKQKEMLEDCLVVQWLRPCAPNAGRPGSSPGQGTKSHRPQLSSHVTEDLVCCRKDPVQPKKKKKKCWNIVLRARCAEWKTERAVQAPGKFHSSCKKAVCLGFCVCRVPPSLEAFRLQLSWASPVISNAAFIPRYLHLLLSSVPLICVCPENFRYPALW